MRSKTIKAKLDLILISLLAEGLLAVPSAQVQSTGFHISDRSLLEASGTSFLNTVPSKNTVCRGRIHACNASCKSVRAHLIKATIFKS